MANIRTVLSTLLHTGFAKQVPPLGSAEIPLDRIDHDLTGLSDADTMWYYERRRWRGRD